MDTIIAVANAVAAAVFAGAEQVAEWYHAFMNIPHMDGYIFAALITSGVVGIPYATKKYSGLLDAPSPGTPPNNDLFEDKYQTTDDILIDIELPAPLPPAPNVPVPSIWGHPNTISYSPGKPWNQALIIHQRAPPAQADSLLAIFLTLFLTGLVASLIWGILCCCRRQKHVAAANDDNSNVPAPPSAEVTGLQQKLTAANNRAALTQNLLNSSNAELALLRTQLEQANEWNTDSECVTSRSSNNSETSLFQDIQAREQAAQAQISNLTQQVNGLQNEVQILRT